MNKAKKVTTATTDSIEEDMLTGLAITWTPRPLTTGDYEPKQQLGLYVHILKSLNAISKKCLICPELHINGSIHFHITIMIIKWQKVTLYKSVIPQMKYKGFVCIKPIDNLINWLQYTLKDKEIMQEILEIELPIDEKHPILQNIKEFTKRRKKVLPKVETKQWEGRIQQQCAAVASSEEDATASGNTSE